MGVVKPVRRQKPRDDHFSAIAVFGLAGFVCPLATPEQSDDALADRLGKAPHNHGDAGGEQTFRGLHLLGEAGLGDGDERNRRIVVALGVADDDPGRGPGDVVEDLVGGIGALEALGRIDAGAEGVEGQFGRGGVFLGVRPVFAVPGREVGVPDLDLAVGHLLDALHLDVERGGFRAVGREHVLHVLGKLGDAVGHFLAGEVGLADVLAALSDPAPALDHLPVGRDRLLVVLAFGELPEEAFINERPDRGRGVPHNLFGKLPLWQELTNRQSSGDHRSCLIATSV